MASFNLYFGSIFISLFLPVLLYLFLLPKTPLLIILSLISALLYLLSLSITSIFMYPIPVNIQPNYVYPLVAISISTLFQEISRFSYVYGYRKLEFLINRFLIKLSSDIIRPLDDTPASISSGIGFATAHSAIMFGFVFSNTVTRPGDFFTIVCGNYPLIFLTSITALEFFFLDIFLMIIAFRALKYQSIQHALFVIICHFAAGISTLTNVILSSYQSNDCLVSIYLLLVINVIAVLYILFIPGKQSSSAN